MSATLSSRETSLVIAVRPVGDLLQQMTRNQRLRAVNAVVREIAAQHAFLLRQHVEKLKSEGGGR